MSDQIFWFATRSAGIMAWFAATLSVLVGLMMSSRVLGRRPTIPWLLDLHRFFGALSIIFLVIHVVTLLLDPFVGFGPADVLVPGAAEVPGLTRMSMAWGVIAGWILVVVELSSLIKKHLPKRFWHTLHLTSLVTVVTGAVHGIQTGSDADNRALVAAAVSVLMASVLVGATRTHRFLSDRRYRLQAAARPRAGGDGRIPAALQADPAPAADRVPARVRASARGEAPRPAPTPAAGIPDSTPPWATGEQPVVTQGEATWNNGHTDWDWNATLDREGSWGDDDLGSLAPPTASAFGYDPPPRFDPVPPQRNEPPPRFDPPPRHDPPPRFDPPPQYAPAPPQHLDQPRHRPAPEPRYRPEETYDPEPDWIPDEAPGLDPARGWAGLAEPAPGEADDEEWATPVTETSGRWALYSADAYEAEDEDEDEGAEIIEFPPPGDITRETKMSYAEATQALRGRAAAPPHRRR